MNLLQKIDQTLEEETILKTQIKTWLIDQELECGNEIYKIPLHLLRNRVTNQMKINSGLLPEE